MLTVGRGRSQRAFALATIGSTLIMTALLRRWSFHCCACSVKDESVGEETRTSRRAARGTLCMEPAPDRRIYHRTTSMNWMNWVVHPIQWVVHQVSTLEHTATVARWLVDPPPSRPNGPLGGLDPPPSRPIGPLGGLDPPPSRPIDPLGGLDPPPSRRDVICCPPHPVGNARNS